MTSCSVRPHPHPGWLELELHHPDLAGLGVRLRYTEGPPATVSVIHHLGGPAPTPDPAYFEALASMCRDAAGWLRDRNGYPEDDDGQGRLV